VIQLLKKSSAAQSELFRIKTYIICVLLIGEVISEKDRCSTCRGKKVVNETKILEVHVDKGMKESQKIYFRGEGDQQVSLMEHWKQ
jgi:DnaJ-class molecular chaperone